MNRIGWVDITKGIGMLLVIIGHLNIPEPYLKYVLAINMPLFFFITGYTIKINMSFKKFIKKKISTLLLPYLLLSLFSYVYWLIIERGFGIGADVNIIKPLVGILYGNNINDWMIFNGVLWFVITLFITEIIFYLIFNRINNNKFIILVIFILSIIGNVVSRYAYIILPMGLNISLTALVFLGTGYIVNQKNVIENMKFINRIITIIVCGVLAIIFSQLNNIVFMYKNSYGQYLLFYIAAFSGIIFWVNTAWFIKKIHY